MLSITLFHSQCCYLSQSKLWSTFINQRLVTGVSLTRWKGEPKRFRTIKYFFCNSGIKKLSNIKNILVLSFKYISLNTNSKRVSKKILHCKSIWSEHIMSVFHLCPWEEVRIRLYPANNLTENDAVGKHIHLYKTLFWVSKNLYITMNLIEQYSQSKRMTALNLHLLLWNTSILISNVGETVI